ncbi:putative transposase [Kribbella sp. VKM Ac-2569]|uniref:IS607 family element RNA-guided endonuclease TnpB n=1 Tax=Kribbella sp. VKM Ac-2569 TaxID=2512220 RepID=UPI00102C000E|nr:IS607 family element RNA-guided endonuclease TnpB [Kribbella sp. VKM Ac-2569]RZT16990.1 putative transposase [Kribbella sp. VKM Ac-2569]
MARFKIPDGWVMQAYRYALDPTPAQERSLASHAGAARFARNHMLRLVKAVLDQRAAERSYGVAEADLTPGLGWSLPALRRVWNARKNSAAPWWKENSKEAYNTGLDSLARSLEAWSKSRGGRRAGRPVGFPRFHTKRARASVRFTTGPIRLEPDRHHVTLPKLGRIRTHESTRKLGLRIESATARVLSATVARDSDGRWYASFQTLVQRTTTRPAHAGIRHAVVGVDVGVKDLLVVATPDGAEVERVPAPRSLARAQVRLRALQRKASRQQAPYDPQSKQKRLPSKRWRRTQALIGKAHARAASIRRDTVQKATTRLAQQVLVITVETLNVSGMRTAGGARKRGLNRALADAALAQVRRMLAYKTIWYGSRLVEADRWYPSSKTCSGCGSRKPRLLLAERSYVCEHCGLVIDRDLNAAINLARLGEAHTLSERSPAGSGPVAGRGATQETEPAPAGDAAGCETSTPPQHPLDQTGTASPQGEAA